MAVVGNKEVKEYLASYLKRATDEDDYALVAITMLKQNGEAICDYAGDPRLEGYGPGMVNAMADMFGQALANYRTPEPDPELGADHVCYSIAGDPLSFDFFNWLIDMEMTRVREGAPAPLKVGFWLGHFPEAGVNVPTRNLWLNNVLRPGIKLIGAVEDNRAIRGRHAESAWQCYRHVVEMSRRGEEVPVLRAPEAYRDHMRRYAGCVTITLREWWAGPARNSNIPEWLRFAEWLTNRGERVVFVRDTSRANEPLPGFPTCPQASTDLLFRMALYDVAKANLFKSNGPSMLGLFGQRPFFIVVPPRPDGHPEDPNTASSWNRNIGVPIGGQFPWCRPDQRLVWQDDTFENLKFGWSSTFGAELMAETA